MNPFPALDFVAQRLELLVQRLDMLKLEEYLCYARNWKKRFIFEFLSGIARGIGFSIGFSILGALMLYALRNVALTNLPVIGKFFAEIVRIVENNL